MNILKNIKDSPDYFSLDESIKEYELNISVSLFFDDFFGNRILPGALPAALQTRIPFYLFGLTDFYGAYNRINNLVTSPDSWSIFNIGMPIIENFNRTAGLAPFPDYLGIDFGDMVLRRTQAGIRSYIIIHCNEIAYGTLLQSFVSDLITIKKLKYYVRPSPGVGGGVNFDQFINPLIFAYQDLFGFTVTDSLDPRMFLINTDFQQNIAEIPIDLKIDKKMIIGSYINFDVEQINFILTIKTIKHLI